MTDVKEDKTQDQTNAAPPALWNTADELSSKDRTYLLYGAAGVLKTRLCAQFPDPLILACDPRKMGGVGTAIDLKPKYIHITGYHQLIGLLPQLKEKAGKEFKTICLDSATYFHRHIMTEAQIQSGREVPRFEEWNLGQARMRTVLKKLAEFDCNIVLTCVEYITKDEVTGKTRGLPRMPGQLADEIPQAVDICLRLFTRSGYDAQGKKFLKYVMSWVPDDPWVYGKDGSNSLQMEMETSGASLKHLW